MRSDEHGRDRAAELVETMLKRHCDCLRPTACSLLPGEDEIRVAECRQRLWTEGLRREEMMKKRESVVWN